MERRPAPTGRCSSLPARVSWFAIQRDRARLQLLDRQVEACSQSMTRSGQNGATYRRITDASRTAAATQLAGLEAAADGLP